ncbi:MAG: hypothetical protein JWM20_572 [Patescibacteria group bacterium]|nr:hypothetical protein [Patescibacteria group bacterium]
MAEKVSDKFKETIEGFLDVRDQKNEDVQKGIKKAVTDGNYEEAIWACRHRGITNSVLLGICHDAAMAKAVTKDEIDSVLGLNEFGDNTKIQKMKIKRATAPDKRPAAAPAAAAAAPPAGGGGGAAH